MADDHHHHDDHHTHGVHGMLILGGHKAAGGRSPVYVSHLPMFMAPHDFQVIMRVAGEGASRYGDSVAHFGDDEIYTFRPEPFPIDEVDPAQAASPRTSFGGTLFRGHFERGGSEIADGVVLEIEQVVHFRRLGDGAEGQRGALRYLCFGERDAAFLAHLITAPPDFDQLLAVELGGLIDLSDEDLRAGVMVTAPERSDRIEDRLREGDELAGAATAQTGRSSGRLELRVRHEHYFETGDLAAAM